MAIISLILSHADVQDSSHAEPAPPKRIIYITPMPAGYLASLPADQQQAHWDSVNSLHDAQPLASNGVSDLAGKYVIPLPPQVASTHKSQQPNKGGGRLQRGQGRQRGGGNQRGGPRPAPRNGAHQRSDVDQKADSKQNDAPLPQRNQGRRNYKGKKGSKNQQGGTAGNEQKA